MYLWLQIWLFWVQYLCLISGGLLMINPLNYWCSCLRINPGCHDECWTPKINSILTKSKIKIKSTHQKTTTNHSSKFLTISIHFKQLSSTTHHDISRCLKKNQRFPPSNSQRYLSNLFDVLIPNPSLWDCQATTALRFGLDPMDEHGSPLMLRILMFLDGIKIKKWRETLYPTNLL